MIIIFFSLALFLSHRSHHLGCVYFILYFSYPIEREVDGDVLRRIHSFSTNSEGEYASTPLRMCVCSMGCQSDEEIIHYYSRAVSNTHARLSFHRVQTMNLIRFYGEWIIYVFGFHKKEGAKKVPASIIYDTLIMCKMFSLNFIFLRCFSPLLLRKKLKAINEQRECDDSSIVKDWGLQQPSKNDIQYEVSRGKNHLQHDS